MIQGQQLSHAAAVRAGSWPGTILASVVLSGLLDCSSPVSAASISGRFDNLSDAVVDLSAEGTLDWGHWGLVTEWSYNHKYGVPQQITYAFITDFQDYPAWDGPFILIPRWGGTSVFGWTNGTPNRVVGDTWNGLSIYGDKLLPGNIPSGFRVQCVADTSPKTLRLYLGNSWGRGTITATLNGAPTYSDLWLDGNEGLNRVYTIDFQADSPGQTLTVEYTCVDPTWYITLQAATLSGTNVPPSAALTAPAHGAVLSAPATFALTAAATDVGGTVTNLSLFRGATLLGNSDSGAFSMTLSNQPPGAYDFLAVATDDGGLSVTSFPVRV